VGFFVPAAEVIGTPSFEVALAGVGQRRPKMTAIAGRLCLPRRRCAKAVETAGLLNPLIRSGACLHFDARFFFERLDDGRGVFFPEAKRNGRFEIFFDNAQSWNG
jgi:hypothetical protein